MKLQRLELQAFRQHRNSRFEFRDGLTGILGTNGAGKSTIIEAIAFALFGSKALRGRVDDVPSKGFRGSTKVTLAFVVEGESFRVERSLHDAALFTGGDSKPIVTGNRDVVSRVTSIVGMNYEEYIATYYTEQKGLEFLSGKKGATEREKFIVRMMGFDKLEAVQELVRADKRDLKNTLTGYEAGVGDLAELKERWDVERRALALREHELAEKTKTLETQVKELDDKKKLFEVLKASRDEWTSAKEKVTRAEARYGELVRILSLREEEKKKLPQDGEAPLTSNTIAELRVTGERNKEKLLEEHRAVQEKVHQLKVHRSSERAGLQAKRSAALSRREELDQILNAPSRRNKKERCPTCGQDLGGTTDEVRAHLAEEVRTLSTEILGLEGELAALDGDAHVLEALELELSEIQRKLEEADEALKVLEAKERAAIAAAKIEEDIRQLREEIRASDGELGLHRSRLLSLRFSEEEFSARKAQYETLQEMVNLLRMQRLQLDGEVQTKRALLERTGEMISEAQNRQEEIIRLKRQMLLQEEADRVLTELRRSLNMGIRPRLAELASDFISDLTDGRYNEVEFLPDFTPTLVDGGASKTVISGGEADLLNICVRLALSQMLAERAGRQFSLLVLDEIFGSLDEQRRFNVLSLLERLSGRFEQIIVITHMEDIKEGVEQVISVVFDEDTECSTVSELRLGVLDEHSDRIVAQA